MWSESAEKSIVQQGQWWPKMRINETWDKRECDGVSIKMQRKKEN
jgi:hypothetical protein